MYLSVWSHSTKTNVWGLKRSCFHFPEASDEEADDDLMAELRHTGRKSSAHMCFDFLSSAKLNLHQTVADRATGWKHRRKSCWPPRGGNMGTWNPAEEPDRTFSLHPTSSSVSPSGHRVENERSGLLTTRHWASERFNERQPANRDERRLKTFEGSVTGRDSSTDWIRLRNRVQWDNNCD